MCTAAGESARIREALSSTLSPVKLGMDAALSAPSYERRHAVGTPDYLAPELLLGALQLTQKQPLGCCHICCRIECENSCKAPDVSLRCVPGRHGAWERG